LQNQIRAKNGSILVTDDWAGAIYRISYSKKYGLSCLEAACAPGVPAVLNDLRSGATNVRTETIL
jgi:hypothetical protein